MVLSVGSHYGECENYQMILDTPYGDVEVTYNYWSGDDIECVTQDTTMENWPWSGTRWFEVQAVIANKLQEQRFHEEVLDDDCVIWQRSV